MVDAVEPDVGQPVTNLQPGPDHGVGHPVRPAAGLRIRERLVTEASEARLPRDLE